MTGKYQQGLTVCGRGIELFANLLVSTESVDLGEPLGAARFHQLAQLPQGDAILRRPPLHRRHAAGPAAAARSPPDNPLALSTTILFILNLNQKYCAKPETDNYVYGDDKYGLMRNKNLFASE